MRQKTLFKRVISVVLTSVTCFSILGGVMNCGLTVKADTSGISNPRIAEDGTVTWDKVTFGSYPQDADFTPEPIKWRILSVNEDGTDAFLIADSILDAALYDDIDLNSIDGASHICMWGNCKLRKWLNDQDDNKSFINIAFSDVEKDAIKDTKVINKSNNENANSSSNETIDKIYLISKDELSNADYGFDTQYVYNTTLCSKGTEYAKYQRVSVDDRSGCGYWWLRTPVNSDGQVDIIDGGSISGTTYDYELCGVRPVLHADLTSSCISDAGKVCSDGSIILPSSNDYTADGYVNPVVQDDITIWDCVYFGKYNQNACFNNKKIEWRVLSVNETNNSAFLISDKVIDSKMYNNGVKTKDSNGDEYIDYSCTWENSSLRKWLNDDSVGNESFISNAFSNEERTAIINKKYCNEHNPQYNTTNVNDTDDYITLLSVEDACNTKYGFDNFFEKRTLTRKVQQTDYARLNGYSSVLLPDWWLRTQGCDDESAVDIDGLGCGDYRGSHVWGKIGIRPVLYVDLSSKYINYVGTVSSDSDMTKEDAETQQKVNGVIALISAIGTVTKDSKSAIDVARGAYDTLSESAKAKVTNYSVLQAAEAKLQEIEKNANNNKKTDPVDNKKDDATTQQTGQQGQTVIDTKTEQTVDNVVSFNIKNNKTYKKSKKVTINDSDGIKSIKLNGKTIKVKSGKKSFSFKLSKYKKYLKQKGKFNKLVVTDINGNKKTIQFKVK